MRVVVHEGQRGAVAGDRGRHIEAGVGYRVTRPRQHAAVGIVGVGQRTVIAQNTCDGVRPDAVRAAGVVVRWPAQQP